MPDGSEAYLVTPPKFTGREICDKVDRVRRVYDEDENQTEIVTQKNDVWVAALEPHEFPKDKVIHIIHGVDDENLYLIEDESVYLGTKMTYRDSGGSAFWTLVSGGFAAPDEHSKNVAHSRAEKAKDAVEDYRIT